MKKKPTFFLLFFVQFILGQNYGYIDSLIANYPSDFNKIENLANKIKYDFQSDKEKVRALYSWLSFNISYDYQNDSFNISDNIIIYFSLDDKKRKLRKRKLNKLENVLKSQKAVCIDYSQLFKEVCDLVGIESKIIFGYSKTNIEDIENEKSYKDHTWNAVKINNKWNLIDVTWASAFTNKTSKKFHDYYFFTPPKELVASHFPVNPKWQLIEKKISKKDFFKGPIFYPNYFINKLEVEKPYVGIVRVNKKKLKIYFSKAPKKGTASYTFIGDKYAKPINFRVTKDGKYLASIKDKKSEDTQITIYADLLPIIGFKVLLNHSD